MTDDLAHAGGFLGRADQPVDAEHLRLLRARLDQIGDIEPVAGGVQIAVVVGGQHGDGENFQARAGARLNRSLHGLRISMHGQKGRAEFRHALDAAPDGISDVMHLEIGEDLLARAREPADHRQSAGVSELIADLVERHAVA